MQETIETLRYVDMLNMFAEKSKYGIHPFSKAKPGAEGVLYDDNCLLKEGQDVGDVYREYPLVADCLIDGLHHDVISYWSDVYDARLCVVVDADGNASYIEVRLSDDDNDTIIIENGRWYFATV